MNPPSLLSPLQRAFLDEFFKHPIGQEFFLTGGTALAEYYLRHRYSEDIDLFTLNNTALADALVSMPAVAGDLRNLRRTRPHYEFSAGVPFQTRRRAQN